MMSVCYILTTKKGLVYVRGHDDTWYPAGLVSTKMLGTKDYPYGEAIFTLRKAAERAATWWNEDPQRRPEERVRIKKVLYGYSEFPEGKTDCVPNDLVWRRNVYDYLHYQGGTGAEPDTWASGWDSAIDNAIEHLSDVESAIT